MFMGVEGIRQILASPLKAEINGFRLCNHESRCDSITKHLWATIWEKYSNVLL